MTAALPPADAGAARRSGANIIDSLDVPIIVVAGDCAVVQFNFAAAALLSLTAANLGRPVREISLLTNVKRLEEECQDAIRDGTSSQLEVRDATNGLWFVLRIAPYLASEQQIGGAVLALQNVSAFRASLEQAIYEREYTKAIINTVIDPLVVLDDDGRVQAANQAFYTKFGVSRDEARGARLYEIGIRDWEVARLESFLKEYHGDTDSDAKFEHEFPGIGRRTVLLKASRLSPAGNIRQMTLLVIQDITDQELAGKRLAVQYAITRVLAESEGLLEAAPKLIRAVCESADWEIGALWGLDKTGEQLRCLEFVNCLPKQVSNFEAATRSRSFSAGIGLPGRVWSSGEPAWIPDVTQDGNFPRAVAAVQDGLHGAFAFPVTAGKQILGVMEFFSGEVRRPEPQLNDLLIGFGKQIGQFAERKRAEAELRESERRFREMVDALPAPVYTTDAQGYITHFNRAAVEFAGRVPELRHDRWCVSWKLFRADGTPLPHDECPMAIALKEGRIVEGVEAITERPDGQRRWCVPNPRPLRDAEGRIVGGVNLLMDITERKQAELATALLADIVDSSDDAIVSKDLDGIITSWNKGAERIFGYIADEAIGQHITLIIPHDRVDEEADILARLRRGERTDHFETVRKRKDGTLLDISVTISPLRDSQGRIVGASKIARDITERKRMERVLKEVELSGRLLLLQDEERRRVARELHDGAGQLLAALSMNTSAIANEKAKLSPGVAKCVEENFSLIEQTMSEIRTLSHLLHPPFLDEIGLKSALNEYVNGFGERSNITVTLDLPRHLDRLPRDTELSLFRIVQECLTNIHRHSGSSTAHVRLSRVPGQMQLEVKDQGRGMSSEVQEKFRSGRSSGVGLRGMRERVRQIGGSLRIESNGNGTSVLVALPIGDEAVLRRQGQSLDLKSNQDDRNAAIGRRNVLRE